MINIVSKHEMVLSLIIHLKNIECEVVAYLNFLDLKFYKHNRNHITQCNISCYTVELMDD